MYYCRSHSDEKIKNIELSSIDIGDFSYKKTTQEYFEPIKIYIDQLKENRNQYSPGYLSKEEEINLFKRVKEKDDDAKNIIFAKFVSMVPNTICMYVGNGVAIEDLVQEGNIALLEAINKYDYNVGYRFSTFAKWSIKKNVRLHIPFYLSSFNTPVNSISIVKKLTKSYEEEVNEFYCDIELKDSVKNHHEKNKNIFSLLYALSPLPIERNNNNLLYESLEDITENHFEDEVIAKILLANIQKNIALTLTEREKSIIYLFYGLDGNGGKTEDEIGKVHYLSSTGIRRLRLMAIRKIKKSISIEEKQLR